MRRRRACLPLIGLLICFSGVTPVFGSGAESLRLEITPNSVQDPAVPMVVHLGLVPGAVKAELRIHLPCPGGAFSGPGPLGEECSPASSVHPLIIGSGRQSLETRIDFAQLPQIPRDRLLWLRAVVEIEGAQRPIRQDVAFSVDSKECGVIRTLLADFFPGRRCRPDVVSALANNWSERQEAPRGTAAWMRFGDEGQIVERSTLSDIDGATGVVFMDQERLLVSRVPDVKKLLRPEDGKPGLFVVSLSGLDVTRIYDAAPGTTPLAPCRSDDGRLLFVSYQGDETLDPATGTLHILDAAGTTVAERAAPPSIYRCLAARGEQALFVTREEEGPGLVLIDLASGTVSPLPWSDALYHAALVTAIDGRSVIEVEDLAGEAGFDLFLLAGQEERRRLTSSSRDEFLPVPSPDGRTVAYLLGSR